MTINNSTAQLGNNLIGPKHYQNPTNICEKFVGGYPPTQKPTQNLKREFFRKLVWVRYLFK